MKKIFFYFLLTLSYSVILGQIPAGYYSNAQNKKGYQLRVALNSIIKNHTTLSYDYLWTAYGQTDLKPNGKIWDMYSDIPGQTPPYEYTYISDQCGNYSGEGVCYNREHSIPKSWFNEASPMVSDLFHIVPTDGSVNGKRSNYPFGTVSSASWTSLNGSKLGSSSVAGYSGTVFEPIDDYKGDFARIYFYMTVCYMDKNLGSTAYSMFTNGSLKPWALNLMIQWHSQDPVSDKEINRNNAAYSIQHNRNPFVDYPELVGKIYGADSINLFLPTSINEFEKNKPLITFTNPSSSELFLFYHSDISALSDSKLIIYDQLGNSVKTTDLSQQPLQIDIADLSKGFYLIKFVTTEEKKVYKLIIQ